MTKSERTNIRTGLEIAVIGMAGRFPGAANIKEYWENLKNGVESISFFSDEELEDAGVDKELINNINYVKAKGCLDSKNTFDAPFFGYSPMEAELMNPQLRIFHECVWEALEDSGYNPESYDDRIGLYAGASNDFYWQALSYLTGKSDTFGAFAASHLTDKDFLCSRVSYNLNLKGASSTVNTACSTSLVAIHHACRALLTGESDIVLAGGVSIFSAPKRGYLYQEGMILSPDGHCRTFDAESNGTVGGEGVGIVVLKRLEPAIEDGDHIYAIIGGTAINNDGKRKVGFTAPSVEAQAEVIRTAQRMARVEAETITYVEAHGTGTALGDPVEIEALKLAFNTEKRNYCGIGSVKTNFGHLDAAAGVAGFIKTILALKYKHIPPTLHFKALNSKIDLENSPFYINTRFKKWESNGCPLRAGVSSFGIGGTNAHVVLEEVSEGQRKMAPGSLAEKKLLLISAKTKSALERATTNLGNHLAENPHVNLADAAYTLQVGRKAFPHRRMLLCSNVQEAADVLHTSNSSVMKTFALKDGKEKRVIFMFPGQGSQYVNMGLDLYRKESMFRKEMKYCFDILKNFMVIDLEEILYPSRGGYPPGDNSHRNSDKINQTEIAQLLLFAFEYALAKLLMNWGLIPTGMIGHSIGEYVAACLAGVFCLEDALKLVAVRGKLMQRMPPGAMLSIPLSEEQVLPLLKMNEGISLAAVNGPSRCVVSGPCETIDAFEKKLSAQGYETTYLLTSHAFHSEMMMPTLNPFEAHVKEAVLSSPQMPFISNVTGKSITIKEATDPAYWAGHIRKTVRFAEGVKELLKKGPGIFIEIGPGKSLSTLVKQHNHKNSKTVARTFNLVRHSKEDTADSDYLLGAIGQLWLYGKSLDWNKYHYGKKRYRVPLPTYSFEGRHYRIEDDLIEIGLKNLEKRTTAARKPDISHWFYAPLWELSIPRPPRFKKPLNWLIFSNEDSLSTKLIVHLVQHGQQVIKVKAGKQFKAELENTNLCIVNPRQPEDYDALLKRLQEFNQVPQKIIHMWKVEEKGGDRPGLNGLREFQNLGFFSLLNIVQAAGRLGITDQIQIEVLTNNMQKVTGEESLCPEKAPLLGAIKIIPLEYPNIRCRSIDLVIPKPGSRQEDKLFHHLLGDFSRDSKDNILAYRGEQRWVRVYRPYPLEKTDEALQRFRERGVYLIIGGFGGMGFSVAGYLAEAYRARLILVGRSAFPPREEWDQWLRTHEKHDDIAVKINNIRQWEAHGGEVMVVCADVSDLEQMQAVIHQGNQRFHQINGVIHAAGVIDYGGVIQKRTKEITEKYMACKVKGTLVLAHLMKNVELDFLVLFSSIGNVIYAGKFGQVSYNAANEFLEAFADYKSSQNSVYTLAINWDDWKEVGMSVRAIEKLYADEENKPDSLFANALSPLEGVEVFNRIIGSSLHRITVSTTDLAIRLQQQQRDLGKAVGDAALERIEKNRNISGGYSYERPELSTPYVSPGTDIEISLVDIFKGLSGIEKIGILDDFFELGGDSLKAMTVLSKIHKALNVMIPLAEFFSHPTIKELTKYIESTKKSTFSSVELSEKKEYYALSSAQKRIYVLYNLEEENITYNQPQFYQLDKVDVMRLEEALRKLIRRHESLRTSFELINEEPVQRVHDDVEFAIKYHEQLCSTDHNPRSEKSVKQVVKNFVRPFNLSKVPLFRIELIEIGENSYIFMQDIHHIISDGSGNGIFTSDFMAFYNNRELPPFKIQYKDFSEWQNSEKKQKEMKKIEKYWLKEFQGEHPVLNLPTDYVRPAIQKFEGSTINFEINHEHTEALKLLASNKRATLYILLLTIYSVFLSKVSSQETVVIGTPIANRNHVDLQRIIGMFTNTLALMNYPKGEKIFLTFLEEVKERTLKAFENQDYPFEDLVDKVVLNRDMSRNPLFDTMFVFQNIAVSKSEISSFNLKPFNYENPTAKFDLTLGAVEAYDRVMFYFEYSTFLFKKETIERFIVFFNTLVVSIIQKPGIKISDIEIISEEEKKQILFNFNDIDAEYPKNKTIHELFEEQIKRTPDNIAVVGVALQLHQLHKKENIFLTYKELNRKSNQLVCLLKEKGVLADSIVGIMLDRSVEMIIGILGILKAGGAYLPIALNYPAERKKYMLEDSRANILLTTRSCVMSIKADSIKEIVCIEEDLSAPETGNAGTPLSLAYIIYTSGSTGRPKGVTVEHRAVVNRLNWMQRAYPIGPGDVILQKTPFTFDVSVWELLWWSFQGASVCLLGHGDEKDPEAISEAIERNKVTTIHFVPSMLNAFLEYLENLEDLHGLSTLKHVFASGEALSVHHAAAFNRLLNEKNNTKLINLYGPTEATVDVSYFNCPVKEKIDKIPIGKPIDNIRLYVVNKSMRLQAVGLAGELCISGDGLARGYINRPELTIEKFVISRLLSVNSHSFISQAANDRLYRTGDLARWLPDGNIEFLGRMDNQVKIRGFRIELGEIECQLLNHNKIKEAVVTAKKNKNGDISLCGYIVSNKEFTVSQLRSHLSERLPDHMLPSYFIPLEKIPLTPNGKVDRRRLPELGTSDLDSGMVYVGPGNIIEKKLVEIWQKVLGINTVSINDNFFEIGGDSIKTIQIVSRMKRDGYKLAMRDIFQNPRIASLAPLTKKIERIAEQTVITGHVPLTPIQQWFFENKPAENHHFNQAVMLYFKEGIEEKAVKSVFSKLQEHHDALRMIYKKIDETISQVNQGLGHPLSLQVFDYQKRKDARDLIESRAKVIQASIDLETGPLMKLGLFHLDDGSRLLIAIHHLVIDGVSWRLLFEDIETLYQQYKKGKPLALPLKTDSFKVWSEKLSEYANSDLFLKEKNCWAELELKQVQKIKKDFEDGDNYMKDVEPLSFSLEETETHLLLTKVNEAFGTEINDILLTALGLAVKTLHGNDRLLVALEGHGREEILGDVDVSRTVGWFTSLYPVILDFSYGEKDLSRQVKEVKERLRQLPNKGIGYGILKYLTRKEHKEEIDFKLNPQVIFNYLGQFDEDLEKKPFEIAQESTGKTYSINQQREFEIDVSGMITGKRLTMSISYSMKQYKRETIGKLLNHFKRELTHVITYCSSRGERTLTPGDFTYPGLSIEMLEQLQRKYSYLIEDIYTLTPMQEGMLFYALFDNKKRTAYFGQMSYRLQGELNVPLMEKSLNELFKRHDVLRTVFIHEGLDRPLQVVLKERNVDFYFEDLRETISNPESKERLVGEFRDKDRQRSFDLSKDVLMRVAVQQLADVEYQVTWSSHHILMDGWCIGILISEFFEIYTSRIENRAFQLPIIKSYRTYIQWLEKQDKNKTRNYWRKYLEGYEEIAAVPKKKNVGIFEGGYKAANVFTRFEEEKTMALNKVAIGNHVTLNTVIQVAWGIVLSKYCSKQDVVYGVLISGRPPEIEGVESMVGCFINTIPVRITFDGKTKLNELLRGVQERAIDSEPHYYYSLAEIQAESALKQNLLDHIIEFQNYPAAERIEGVGDKIRKNKTTETLKLSDVNVREQGNYDFNIMIIPGSQIYLGFSYNANVYDSQLVEQLGFNSIRVLEQIIEDDKITIDEIALLSEEERRKILFEFNNNRADFPRDKTIYQFVEKHAELTPDRIPLVSVSNGLRDITLNYKELNEKANGLARILRSNGIQKDETVGILMERSQEMVESILAVWKAGGAYIPLDIAYPPGRTAGILQDSATKVLITREEYVNPQLEKEYEGEIVKPGKTFPGMSGEAANQAIKNPALEPCMNSLAYVIYTSGSTGKPKGVMIEHLGMMNHIQAKINDLHLTRNSVVAQNATHTFDISVWQFFAALIPGGKTIVHPDKLILDPEKFVSRLVKDNVTILEVVPSYLSMLLDDEVNQLPLPSSLQYLLVTGEEIKPQLVIKWFDRYPGIKVVNAYGPTEASDDITHYIMEKPLEITRTPIGKPLQNLNIYIADSRMQLCPVGVRGEICVAGVGVGRGYLGDEEKTKQSFMEDPFREEKGVRLYKTGDMGCWLPDGNIEFFGRKDYQVKIRGFRIELGEIENQLLNHPGIKEAVVIDREDKMGNNYLCAYVVHQPYNSPELAELKEFLSENLPDYMLPDHFTQLDKIPLTSSGKIDRKALPVPEESEIVQKYAAPTNTMEKKLVEIWADVLGKEKGLIGINHSFFDLGGHSLKAIVLVSKVHKEFDVKLPLAELFKAPTIRDLVQYIEKAVEDRFTSIEPAEKKEYYVLSSAQKRLYIEQQMNLEGSAYNMSQIIMFEDKPDKRKLEETFRKLIDRHESLRTSFHLVAEVPVQKVHEHVEFFINDFETDEKKARQIAGRYQRPFDLSTAPLLRAALFNVEQKHHVLLVVMHHIITDGTSYPILIKDFNAFYEEKELPLLKLQYKEYAEWQNSPGQQEVIKKQEKYWLKEFEGEMPVLNLSTGYENPAGSDVGGSGIKFVISKEETAVLRKLTLEEGATLFMVLLTLFYILLSKVSGQEDIVIGTPAAGRGHEDLKQIIGMFVNTLALRNYPTGDKTFKEFFKEVKERTLEAFENQDYQFEDLVGNVLTKRDAGQNPLFDVMFVMQNQIEPGKNALEIDNPKPYKADAKFDLSLTAVETEENIALDLICKAGLFKAETIERFSQYFREIVTSVLDNEEIKIMDIKISHELFDQKLEMPREEGDFVF